MYSDDNKLQFKGKDTWVNQRTGETIEADQVVKQTGRNGFMITYLSAIISLIEVLGNKKMQVVKYILSNMDKSNNLLLITTVELSQKSKVSRQVVSDTLKILESHDIITRKIGVIMINPNLVHRGSNQKEKYLLTKFQELKED